MDGFDTQDAGSLAAIRHEEAAIARRFFHNKLNGSGDSPCPATNPSPIGTNQTFNILCGNAAFGFDPIGRPTKASSLLACVDSCAAAHPRCESVGFDGVLCFLAANMTKARRVRSFRFDLGFAVFPQTAATASACPATLAAGSVSFNMECGLVINGGDLSQAHSASLTDCMSLCAATPACTALSFDATMAMGFENCYLKSSVPTGQPEVVLGIDSAIVGQRDAAPANNAIAPPSVATTVVAASTVTPPPLVSESTSTITSVSTITSGGSAISTVLTVTQSVAVVISAVPSLDTPRATANPNEGGTATTSLSPGQIAGPVAGGIVALVGLMSLLAWLLRRRARDATPDTSTAEIESWRRPAMAKEEAAVEDIPRYEICVGKEDDTATCNLF
ncbi:hypothetical protein GQ53DRAFT_811353 [Thozetella sp. PMI_491]|nr:hypothetical protein GQ53DRAFT_811353 [Thozetella sp. PMI_491]